jgi:integrase
VETHDELDWVAPAGGSLGFPRLVGTQDATPFVDFARERQAMGAGPATVAVDWSLICSALGAAKPMFGVVVDTAVLDEARPVLDRMNLIGRPQSRDRRVSKDEEARLVAEFDRVSRHPSTLLPMADIVRFALACPRRLGEITRLRWDDVDRENKVVLLRDVKHPRRKMGNHQQVPLVEGSWAIAMRQPVLSEFIFPYKTDSISSSFERAVKRLGIEDLNFHDLRHEGITRLFEAGLSIQQVALVSGHRSWATLRRYTHLRAESVHKALRDAGSQTTQEAGAEPQGPRAGDDRHPDGQDV